MGPLAKIILYYNIMNENIEEVIGGSRGRRQHAPPQQDQFLSFSHMFSPKSVRVGGWRPPTGWRPPPPPTGNPGSATGSYGQYFFRILSIGDRHRL